jgi:AmmeMemoRadiSam system protein B/AmmeMemoRadiSam system protein A
MIALPKEGAMTMIRPTAVAGTFYPAQAELARQEIRSFLAGVAPPIGPAPKAIIVPHAGWVFSGPIAAHAYARLAPLAGRIRRVVLLGPAHRVPFRGIALSGAEAWASPLGPVPLDSEGARILSRLPAIMRFDDAHAQEHALEVQLPFLQCVLGDGFRLLPLLVGDDPPEHVAAALDLVWGGPETLVVVSTDLSHYLDADACRLKDDQTRAAIESLDPARLGRDDACGRLPLAGLLLVARRRGLRIETLDIRHSGDTAGTRDRVVGYGAWALIDPNAPEEEDMPSEALAIRAAAPILIDLAWTAIRQGLASGRSPSPPPGLVGVLAGPGAAFVTLKRNGQLRGCIGSPRAWRPLAEDVCDNAFKAAFADPRFPPLTASELEGLDLSISVLTPPRPMQVNDQADLLSQLRPRQDGLIIEDRGRSALFLPSVWEQLPDPAAFLTHLKAKAGMRADHWSDTFRASRFAAIEINA